MFLRLSLAGSFIPLLSADVRNEGRPYYIFSGFDRGNNAQGFWNDPVPAEQVSLPVRSHGAARKEGRPAAQHPAALMTALISPANLTPSVN